MVEAAQELALEIWTIARTDEQCARVIVDDVMADEVRRRVRALAALDGIKVRTGRMDDTVMVVRLDAKVWREDAASMRRKLSAA